MSNRRNYYRLLHVQPEAPIEIIKASYRSLMTKLNTHPDRGGDHETAVLINQAYAVLSDPQRRRKYDEMLLSRSATVNKRPTDEATAEKSRSSKSGDNTNSRGNRENVRSTSQADRLHCYFCGTAHQANINKYCTHCQSPLAPVYTAQNRKLELFGRRTMPRIAKTGTLTVYPSWPHAGYPAQLQDLSTSGLCILTAYSAKVGQIMKCDSNFLKGVARVVTVRANGSAFTVHGTFLAAEFITKSGVFFTEKA
jgi:curved DNA-binding protein CbpA